MTTIRQPTLLTSGSVMPGPARGRNTREKVVEINEADVLPHAAAAG